MTLRLDIKQALRDAGRRDDPYELEFMLYIKECLCAYERRPKKKPISRGQDLSHLERSIKDSWKYDPRRYD